MDVSSSLKSVHKTDHGYAVAGPKTFRVSRSWQPCPWSSPGPKDLLLWSWVRLRCQALPPLCRVASIYPEVHMLGNTKGVPAFQRLSAQVLGPALRLNKTFPLFYLIIRLLIWKSGWGAGHVGKHQVIAGPTFVLFFFLTIGAIKETKK